MPPVFMNAAGQPIAQIQCGEPYSFAVPGYSQVWLRQTSPQRGTTYDGVFPVPMPLYTADCVKDVAQYHSEVFEVTAEGSPGTLIGSVDFTVLGPQMPVATQQTSTVLPAPPPGQQVPTYMTFPSGTPQSTVIRSAAMQSVGPIYRFFLESDTPYHRYDSGANYPGCSRSNTEACDPQQFTDFEKLKAYAASRSEMLYRVDSVEEVWSIIEGQAPIDPSKVVKTSGLGTSALVLGGLAALFFLTKKKKS